MPYRAPVGLKAMSVMKVLVSPITVVLPVATSTVTSWLMPVLSQSVRAAWAASAAPDSRAAAMADFRRQTDFMGILYC